MQRSNSTTSCWPSAFATRDQVLLSWFKTPGNLHRYRHAPFRDKPSTNPVQLSRSSLAREVQDMMAKEGLKYRHQTVRSMLSSWSEKYDLARAKENDDPKAVKAIFPYYYEVQPFEHVKPTSSCDEGSSQPTTTATFTRQHSTTTTMTTTTSASGPISTSYWQRPSSLHPEGAESQSTTLVDSASSVTKQQEPSSSSFNKQHESTDNAISDHPTAVVNEATPPPGFGELMHQSNENMRRTVDVLLQQQQLFVGFVRSQDMEKQALLIRAMHDAGFSKDEVLSVLRGYDERYQSQPFL
ncbi:predicted protein [Lichtheimia corymbifera JMRC:FSU:9682]|uniref:Uncharacterized protein n=1 Tax=Lichtheimia corymbifera JMRC:FSU:9682 TaxID=1263082 RepID=A0A068RP16_9FUNG|nr:predicted protein [Lichtheimia corymbifera JMRC:FSU:9682]